MIIIIDANIVIAALMGSRAKITILTSQNHSFYAPRKIIDEIQKYKAEICEKTEQSSGEFEGNSNALLKFVNSLEHIEYEEYMRTAQEAIEHRDAKDADYIACALAVGADFIWTDDKDFTAQNVVKVKTTTEFIQSQQAQ